MTEKLSERVQRLEGPDREIEEAIYESLGNCNHKRYECYRVQGDSGQTCLDCGKDLYGADRAPRYTADLNAAMSLVPEGWGVMLHVSENGLHSNVCLARSYPTNLAAYGEAKSLALALCAAALKARGL